VLASRSETARGEWQVFHGLLKVSPTGSVAYKLAMVAAGKGDATFTRSPKSEWDIASGAALIMEAGGVNHRHQGTRDPLQSADREVGGIDRGQSDSAPRAGQGCAASAEEVVIEAAPAVGAIS